MSKLANLQNRPGPSKSVLTGKTEVPFKISLERSLDNNYCFKKLKSQELKVFNTFIDKTVGKKLSFKEVDKLYLRHPDNHDEIDGHQVHHYSVGNPFRIHGYLKDGYFVLCRIDPSHRYHK